MSGCVFVCVCVQTFSTGSDGVSYLSEVHDTLVPALVTVVQSEQDQQGVTLLACQHAADTLAAIASNDQGIEACLKHGVPAAVVQLLQRCLTGTVKASDMLNGTHPRTYLHTTALEARVRQDI